MKAGLSKNLMFGALWTTFQTLGTKLFSTIGQLVLAWVLLPDDFGKIGLAYTVTTLGTLMQNFGLSEVMVSRGKSFDVLVPLAKSVSAVAALACWLTMIVLGIFGGLMYGDIEITYLVLIFSLSVPFNTLSVLPEASVRRTLKFKELSFLQIYTVFFTQLLTIVFALLSFKVYSFVLPTVIVSVLRYLYLNRLSGMAFAFAFTLRRWQHLVMNSSWGFAHAACQRIIQQFDFVILGLFTVQAEVGIYYLAFSLSVQAIGLLVGSIAPVMLPTLIRIPKEDVAKKKEVLLKLTFFFAMFGMPFALWQAAAAKPFIVLFLSDNWLDCIELIQILSIGVGFKVVSSLWEVALQLRSEFRKQAFFSLVSSVYFILLIAPLSYFYNSTGTALGVALFQITSSPALLYFAFRAYGVKAGEILYPMVKYFLLSFGVFGSFYFLALQLHNIYADLIINAVVSPLIYVSVIWLTDRKAIREFISKIKDRNK